MKKYNFYSALEHCHDLYGVDLDEDIFETYALSAWHKIGNRDTKMYLMHGTPECDAEGGWFVCLPCNLESIEAVTLPYEDAKNITSTSDHFGIYSHPIEDEIEREKRMPNELYIPGKYVKYKEVGDKIYFTEPLPMVNILYKGLYADEEGLPMLNMREVEAIACYCAYCSHFKKSLVTKDTSLQSLAALLKNEWLQLCSRARVSESISQNSMNEILSAMTSFNRGGYGRTYKPIH